MGARISVALLGLLMTTAPYLARADTSSADQLTNAQLFAAVAGKVVGAASACDDINSDRISTAAAKASIVSSLAANDNDDVASAQALFAENDDYGRALVQSGRTDCTVVNTSLARLEKAEEP